MSHTALRVMNTISHELVFEGTLTKESRFVEDLGADSLDVIELVIALEDEFGIRIPDPEWQKVNTVEQAIECVERHVSAKKE